MHEVEILLISRWKELECDLVHNNQSTIEIHPYLSRADYPDFPAESYDAYWNFLDVWDDIYYSCPPDIAKNVETAFLVQWEPSDGKNQQSVLKKDDLPLSQILTMPHSGVWALVTCSLCPESVRKIAEVTRNFDLDSYLAYFDPSVQPDYFTDKQKFKTYSQIWLDYFNLAAATEAGIVIIRR